MATPLKQPCPRCGNPSDVSKGAILRMCHICLMRAADAVDAQEIQKQGEYDWRQIILCIKKKYALNQTQAGVASILGLKPPMLSLIKRGKRPMPEGVMKMLKDKFSDCIALKQPKLT